MGVGYIKGTTYYIEKMKTERDDTDGKAGAGRGVGVGGKGATSFFAYDALLSCR